MAPLLLALGMLPQVGMSSRVPGPATAALGRSRSPIDPERRRLRNPASGRLLNLGIHDSLHFLLQSSALPFRGRFGSGAGLRRVGSLPRLHLCPDRPSTLGHPAVVGARATNRPFSGDPRGLDLCPTLRRLIVTRRSPLISMP
eukprot:scaffold108444_cov27-Tisochrysis_lutea.AAC.2